MWRGHARTDPNPKTNVSLPNPCSRSPAPADEPALHPVSPFVKPLIGKDKYMATAVIAFSILIKKKKKTGGWTLEEILRLKLGRGVPRSWTTLPKSGFWS